MAADEALPMTARTLQDAAAAPAALTAFLRGVERRAAVFGGLVSGSDRAGDEAVEGAMRAFRRAAPKVAFVDWSTRFWTALLAEPGLRAPAAPPAWPAPFEWLEGIGLGPRAALLLRLVAGLSEAEAAAVLGVARPTYRLALSRALPRGGDAEADPEQWRALGEAAQAAVRGVPADRLAQLARRREAAMAGRPLAPDALRTTADADADDDRPRRPWRWMAAVAVLTLLALAATWKPWTWRPGGDAAAEARIHSEPLPPAEAPASRWPADAALATHPDLALLSEGDPVAADPGFHAWLAAEFAASDSGAAVPAEAQAPLPGEVPSDAMETVPETSDVP